MFVKYKSWLLSVGHPKAFVGTEVNAVEISIKFKEWRI